MTKATVLFIGDPHFQVSNITSVELFLERITVLAVEKQPDAIIIAGDLLHNHERLHTIALNKAYELVKRLRDISPTYVLVGNHDYIQNQQFLTSNHWMNGMKEWHNTVIVDRVHVASIQGFKMIMVPYVPPGRFIEALDTVHAKCEEWRDAACIYAHQEFQGCKMGSMVSTDGDAWPEDGPYVVSGHIHSRQTPQPNIYYSGSAMQHAFGESEVNSIAHLTFTDPAQKYTLDEIDLDLPRKRIVHMDMNEIDSYSQPNTQDELKLTLSGDQQQFKAFKKTERYTNLLKSGTKVVFKPTRAELKEEREKSTKNACELNMDFPSLLRTLVDRQRNPYLLQTMEHIVNDRAVDIKDILYL